MIKRIFLGSTLLAAVLIFLLFGFRNYITENFLTRYIKENFRGDCVIEKVRLGVDGIKVYNLKFMDEDMYLFLKKGSLDLRFNKGFNLEVSKISMEDGYLCIKDLEKTKKKLAMKIPAARPPQQGRVFSPRFDLKDMKVEFKKKGELSGSIDFSIKAKIDNGSTPVIEEINIFDSNFQSPNFSMKHLRVKKSENYSLYTLALSELMIQDKKIKDIMIIFDFTPGGIKIKEIKSKILGEEFFAGGEVDLENYKNICLKLDLNRVSLRDAVHLVDKENSIDFEGVFEGGLSLCFDGGELSEIEGRLSNDKGGLINILSETPVSFLRKYLTEASYRALVDNFKNYEYNNGEIKVDKQEGVLGVTLNFESEKMGRRNIVFNFYEAGGTNVKGKN